MACRILVADDEELERRALSRILSGSGPEGIEILEASNGNEALAAAAGGGIDAAFLDIKMPGIDGIEAARSLRESIPELPIIFLTAHDSFEYARSALRLRVEDFLLKPASSEEVLAALGRAIGRDKGRASPSGAEASRQGAAPPRDELLESAVSFVAAELRAALASGRVEAEGLSRYAAMRCSGGELAALVALRPESCESGALPGGRDLKAALCAVASLAERALWAEGFLSLAGAGEGEALCAILDAPGSSTAEEIGPALSSLLERARAELGLCLAAGAVLPSTGTLRGGARPSGRGFAAAPARGIVEAALRALALAGRKRPVVLVCMAASGDGAERDEAQRPGLASRALELMATRCAEELSLDSVAAELGVSPSHLSRLIGKQAGLGFADCLARIRVERAKAYLSSGRVSVKEASAMVGYRDQAYFARVFRRFCGMSPAEYRSGGASGGEK